MVALANCHKLFGLKQHMFILLKFWKSEIQNQFYWAKVKVPAGPSFLKRHREIFLSQSLEPHPMHYLALHPCSLYKATQQLRYFGLYIAFFHSQISLCLLLTKTFVITSRVHLDSPK